MPVTLATVSHDTGDVEEKKQTCNVIHLARGNLTLRFKTVTDILRLDYAAEEKVRQFPKQTYLSSIQTDQRLVMCHNFALRVTTQ